jgi:hypothetical protein
MQYRPANSTPSSGLPISFCSFLNLSAKLGPAWAGPMTWSTAWERLKGAAAAAGAGPKAAGGGPRAGGTRVGRPQVVGAGPRAGGTAWKGRRRWEPGPMAGGACLEGEQATEARLRAGGACLEARRTSGAQEAAAPGPSCGKLGGK